MDRGDALAVTLEVWSSVGLLPGLVVLGTALLLFCLLDWAIGDRIAGRGTSVGRVPGNPHPHHAGTSDGCGGDWNGKGTAPVS